MRDETRCDGIMVARGSHGDPWIFRQARAALEGEEIPLDPDAAERFGICVEHAENAIAYGGDLERAVREFRKHLGWYTKGLPGGKDLRQELFAVTSLEQVKELLSSYLERHSATREGGGEPRPAEAVLS